MKEKMIANPLPEFQDSFVDRKIVGDMLVIKPVLPKPDELAAFYAAAINAGFREEKEVLWGLNWAPAFYYRPVSEEQQRDWRATEIFKRMIRFHDETSTNFDEINGSTCDIGTITYRVEVDHALRVYRKNENPTGEQVEWILVEVAYY